MSVNIKLIGYLINKKLIHGAVQLRHFQIAQGLKIIRTNLLHLEMEEAVDMMSWF